MSISHRDPHNVRRDLQDALASWACSGEEAFIATETIFEGVSAAVRKRFADISRDEVDLLFADIRRDSEAELFDLMAGSVDLQTAIDIVVERFLGGDE